jgi:hypothetical protein
MTMRVLYLGLAALLAVSACAKNDKTADTGAQLAPSPTDLARSAALVANAVAANPAAADSILKAAGHTQESFQRQMYEIAADSAMSAVYAKAKNP